MTNFFQGLIAFGYFIVMVGAIRLWWVLPRSTARMFAPVIALAAGVWVVVYGAAALDVLLIRHVLSNFGQFLMIVILASRIHVAGVDNKRDKRVAEEVEGWTQ